MLDNDLVVKRYINRFRIRFMFPLTEEESKFIGFKLKPKKKILKQGEENLIKHMYSQNMV